MSEKITMKTNKDIIFKSLQTALKKIEDKNAQVFDPTKISVNKQNEETMAKVEKISSKDLNSAVNKLQKDFEEISESLLVLKDIKEAISLKETELKGVYGIEIGANTLASIINAQKELKDIFNEDKVEAELELKEELTNLKLELKVKEEEFKARMKTEEKEFALKMIKMNEDANTKRARDEEQWEYDFGRYKKSEQNKLQDSLKELETAHSEMVKEATSQLLERENIVEAREKIVDDLEREVAQLKASKETDIAEAVEKEKKREAKSSGLRATITETGNKGKFDLLENKIETLEANLLAEKEMTISLSAKLDNAYKEMKELAKETVSGKSNDELMNSIKSLSNKNN